MLVIAYTGTLVPLSRHGSSSMHQLTSAAAAGLMLIAMTACAPERAATSSADADTAREMEMEMEMPDSQDQIDIESVIDAAKAAFAERMAVALDAVEVISARRVTWGDGAVGCPEPGMMYTQALVPGFYVHLRSRGEDGFFHAARDGQPFYCPKDRSQPPVDRGDLR